MTQPIDGDNTEIVQTLLLWRIYDTLLLLLRESNPEVAAKLLQMHEGGLFATGNKLSFRDESEDQHSGE